MLLLEYYHYNPFQVHLLFDGKDSSRRSDCVNNVCINQTENLYGSKDIERMINEYLLDAIIIGSDAVVQHHPLFSRIHKGRRKPFYIAHPVPERMFPNPFCGVPIANIISRVHVSLTEMYFILAKVFRILLFNDFEN